MSFTAAVKEELAALRPAAHAERTSLLAGLLHLGATLHLGGTVGPRATLVFSSESGGVSRLVYGLLSDEFGVRSDIRRRDRGQLAPRARYEIVLTARVEAVLHATGRLDAAGGLVHGVARSTVRSRQQVACYLRGAFMAKGSVSGPGRAPHLEIGTPDERTAADLAGLLARLQLPARAAPRGPAHRVVLKGGEAIGLALVELGARDAYLAWEDGRIRREVRAGAVRLANADQANLARSVRAAMRQVADAERALATDALPPALVEVATLRVGHPQASLAELGALLDPPRSKATVGTRLRRIAVFGRPAEPTSLATAERRRPG